MGLTALRPTCKGGYCDNVERCQTFGSCTYKSSAQEARERMNTDARVDALEARVAALEFRTRKGGW